MTSSSQGDKSLLEECFDENTQILNKEEGEVGHNNEFDDLEPSLYSGEIEKEECELEYLELSGGITIDKAQTEELPGYIVEFEEETMLKFSIYAQTILGKFGRVGVHIDLSELRRKISLKLVEIWDWDTYPWDPRVWEFIRKIGA